MLTKAAGKTAAATEAAKETLRETWIGKLSMGAVEPVMQFRIMNAGSGERKAYFDSVTEGRIGFPGSWAREGELLKFEIPAIGLTFTGKVNKAGDAAEGTWSQGGRELPLTFQKQDAAYRNSKTWENRPQRPRPPFPYTAEEVRFENATDTVTLAGTLTLPPGKGPHPAVVLITGSGPQDRDEFLMQHRPFLVLADHLTRHGIAVLRYDDRGTAQSTGRYAGATVVDFARDASAAIEFLRRDGRIDLTRIGLIGHGEGGLVAPIVAKTRSGVAFLVLLGATGVDGKSVLLSQSEAMRRASGMPEMEIEVAMRLNRSMLEIASRAEPGRDLMADLMNAVDRVLETLPEACREAAD